ncbi:MAG: hypothetical protein IJF69_06215 [Clostridia bacterium]|nr:hypothetical protein [Clostridia bacterium]
MPNKTIDALAFCPFYISEAKTTITCEGIIGASTVSKFKTEIEKTDHEMNFCTGKACQGCGVFSAIMQNYSHPQTRTVLRH